MKKLLTLVCALALSSTLAFAQAGGSTGKDPGKAPDKVQLNPQPEPPGVTKSKNDVAKSKNKGRTTGKTAASKVELNPQPLPPGAHQELNPQPLPPKVLPKTANTSTASKVQINPQPLPPGGRKTDAANKKSKKGNSSTNTGTTTPK